MKKSNYKIQIFTATVVAVLVMHFSFTLAYNFRDNLPYKIVATSDKYTLPFFHQNWKLFAPDLVKYNVELEYRTAQNEKWNDWKDASLAQGFPSNSKIETIEQGFNNALNWQVLNNYYSKNGEVQFDRITQSPAYASALFFVMKLHRTFQTSHDIDSVQIRLNYQFTPPPNGIKSEPVILTFPIFAPHQ